MKKLILPLIVLFAFASCDKNQGLVKKLEGEWTIESYRNKTFDDNDFDFTLQPNSSMEFETCKLKEDDCDGEVTITGELTYELFGTEYTDDYEVDEKFTYAVTESGNEIFITYKDEDGDLSTVEYDMTLEDDVLELESIDGDVTIELERLISFQRN